MRWYGRLSFLIILLLSGTLYPAPDIHAQQTSIQGIITDAVAGITDKRDAGSVFTAWLPVPVGESQMQAIHALLGWSQS